MVSRAAPQRGARESARRVWARNAVLEASPNAVVAVDRAGLDRVRQPPGRDDLRLCSAPSCSASRSRSSCPSASAQRHVGHPDGVPGPSGRPADGHRPRSRRPAQGRHRVPGRDQPLAGRDGGRPPGLRHDRRHHRAQGRREPAAPGAEARIDRPAGRRDRPRLQQHAVRDPRLRRAPRAGPRLRRSSARSSPSACSAASTRSARRPSAPRP